MTARAAVEPLGHVNRRGLPAVLLRVHGVDVAMLSPLEVGRLRAQLRDAVLEAAQAAQLLAEQEGRRA